MNSELKIDLKDTEWQFDYINHDRNIVRAIVYDEDEQFYFVRVARDDDFGKAVLIETSGGGVEEGEDLLTAIKRELKEELGASVAVICKIGVVSDYYNLLHRHNINNYFLCKVESFGDKCLTEQEKSDFHLTTLKMSYEDAVKEYEVRANTKLGKLIAARELPVLRRAKEIIADSAQHKYRSFLYIAKLLNEQLTVYPLLYGSLGLEKRLSACLHTDDIDVLIPEKFLKQDWDKLLCLMNNDGYNLIDAHEHEFSDGDVTVAFAALESLSAFAEIEESDIPIVEDSGVKYLLLELPEYLKVYEASSKDGYRKNVKNKQDCTKIVMIKDAIENKLKS